MLRPVHLELGEANALVARDHRHHKPCTGHRFSVGAFDTKRQTIIGAAIVGRPVARNTDQRNIIEVTRCVTDGTKNACSLLYAAAARSAQELGYRKIQTFILAEESGVSLIAAGWILVDDDCGGGNWKRSEGTARRQDQPQGKKKKYMKFLNPWQPPHFKVVP